MTYTIYGRPGCGPCMQAKSLLQAHGKDFTYINIFDLSSVALEDFTDDYKSVPQIFLGDKHLGGLKALQDHLKG